MNEAKNPTEKVMSELTLSWLEASENAARTRIVIWRVPAGGESLLDAFIALQQHPQGRTLPDLFLGLNLPFETGYGYSEALGREFVEHYEATDNAAVWNAEPWLPCYSPAQLHRLLQNFAQTFTDDLRYLLLVLKPAGVSDESALIRWLTGWLEQSADAPRLLLIDTVEQPVWQPLLSAHPREVQLIVDEIDSTRVMHQTAQQQTDADADRLLFRRYLADAMLLLEKGSMQQVAARGELGLGVATRCGWADQQSMMHNLIAGKASCVPKVPSAKQGPGLRKRIACKLQNATARRRWRPRRLRTRCLKWRGGACLASACGWRAIAPPRWKSMRAPCRRLKACRCPNAARQRCRWCSRICYACMINAELSLSKPAPNAGNGRNSG